MAEKPPVLIIGGLGYIGRFLARHIHENELASEVRLVDKVLPQLAWLPPEFEEACAGSKFVQADASRERTSTISCLFLLLTLHKLCPQGGRGAEVEAFKTEEYKHRSIWTAFANRTPYFRP